jgi:hypothetical protein
MMRMGWLIIAFLGSMLSIPVGGYAEESGGVGLVTGVDVATSTLTLETRSGPQRIVVASTATIDDDHGQALALRDIYPGDAVAYQSGAGLATSLHVARQFWAIPSES